MHVLYSFIGFQQEYRIEGLPIVQEHFNTIERRIRAFKNSILLIVWGLTGVWYIIAQIIYLGN